MDSEDPRSKSDTVAGLAAQAAPVPARFTRKQMERALSQVQKKRSARQNAREEEKAFLAFKKAQVLRDMQPTVGVVRIQDDAFPKARPRASMEFGERKSFFLSIRPNPKYATWKGLNSHSVFIAARKKPQAHVPHVVATNHAALPPPSSSQSAGSSERSSKSGHSQSSPTNPKPTVQSPARTSVRDFLPSAYGPAPAEEPSKHQQQQQPGQQQVQQQPAQRRGGRHADNPLVNGVPFWVRPGAEQEELTDDDLPVDMNLLEEVCNGKKKLAARDHEKTTFCPFGGMQRFRYDDVLFDRRNSLLTTTVEAVLGLQPDDDRRVPLPDFRPRIRWADKLSVTVFDPTQRGAPVEGPFVEELKDHRRERLL